MEGFVGIAENIFRSESLRLDEMQKCELNRVYNLCRSKVMRF